MLTTPSGWFGSDVIEYARHCRTPLTSMPMRRYWPAWCPGQSKFGFTTIVRASSVSSRTRMTTPVSSRVDHRGLISAR